MTQEIEIPKAEYNFAEYEEVTSESQIVELINGDIILTPPSLISHQEYVQQLHIALWKYFENSEVAGKIYLSPIGVKTLNEEVFEPDLLIIFEDNYGIIKEKYIEGSPDIIIEILSPSTKHRDWGVKTQKYQELGVKEYWIIDPSIHKAFILIRDNKDDFKIKEEISLKENKLHSILLPNFSFPEE